MRAWVVGLVLLLLVLALAATRDIKLRSPPMPAETCPALPDPVGSPARLVPSILLIGERKCGSTSLARYLGLHSHVLPPKVKEPGYLMRPRSQLSLAEYSQYFALASANRSCHAAAAPRRSYCADGCYWGLVGFRMGGTPRLGTEGIPIQVIHVLLLW